MPRILSGEETWCQGYSEPGAGSDLAALGTKAVRDGDAYIVDGQKTWTSGAHKADWMFWLARTRSEGKPQAGITFLLIDMRSRGITIEPIVSMDRGHYLNNVFLDNVRVPIEQRVGEENEGWTYAKFLLSNERTGIAGVGRSKQRLEQVKAIVRPACDERERTLREAYDKILGEKLQEQYQSFAKFNEDYISRQLKASDLQSYVS